MKYVVIGAGPVGCYAGWLLAKKGHDVEIYEEHSEIGLPFQCTGILTSSFKGIFNLPENLVDNTIKKIKVSSPDGRSVSLSLKNKETVLNRVEFDKYMGELAERAGVKLFLKHRFIGLENGKAVIKDFNSEKTKHVVFDRLIGADGPNSSVRKILNPRRKMEFYIGAQATVKNSGRTDRYETYFGSSYPYFFGWFVPESDERVRIGLAAKKNSADLLKRFMERKLGKDYKEIVCENQGGLIPIYKKDMIVKRGKLMIIGDAAAHVKATTAGGIIPGMLGAKELIFLEGRKTVRSRNLRIGKQLGLHLLIRKVLDKFSDNDYNKLIRLCSQRRIKKILETYSRDNITGFFFRLIIMEPRFLLFAMKLI